MGRFLDCLIPETSFSPPDLAHRGDGLVEERDVSLVDNASYSRNRSQQIPNPKASGERGLPYTMNLPTKETETLGSKKKISSKNEGLVESTKQSTAETNFKIVATILIAFFCRCAVSNVLKRRYLVSKLLSQ